MVLTVIHITTKNWKVQFLNVSSFSSRRSRKKFCMLLSFRSINSSFLAVSLSIQGNAKFFASFQKRRNKTVTTNIGITCVDEFKFPYSYTHHIYNDFIELICWTDLSHLLTNYTKIQRPITICFYSFCWFQGFQFKDRRNVGYYHYYSISFRFMFIFLQCLHITITCLAYVPLLGILGPFTNYARSIGARVGLTKVYASYIFSMHFGVREGRGLG